jgi:hypothetical protein
MNALSQDQMIRRLVSILSRLAALANSDEHCESDAALLVQGPSEKDESLLLVKAAGYAFVVPGNLFCSLLTPEEFGLLRHLLDAWDELSFQQRALAKEALLLLSSILPPLVPRRLGEPKRGELAMKEMAIARMRLGS